MLTKADFLPKVSCYLSLVARLRLIWGQKTWVCYWTKLHLVVLCELQVYCLVNATDRMVLRPFIVLMQGSACMPVAASLCNMVTLEIVIRKELSYWMDRNAINSKLYCLFHERIANHKPSNSLLCFLGLHTKSGAVFIDF